MIIHQETMSKTVNAILNTCIAISLTAINICCGKKSTW